MGKVNLSYEDLKALVMLNRLGNRRTVIEYLMQGVAPAEVAGDFEDKLDFNPEKEIEMCEKLGVRFVTWFDAEYPRLLKEIYDPPLALYAAGNFEAADEAALAIVGTRHPSMYGMEQAKIFSRELAQAGLTIVSGFAKGIDQAAHEAALEIPYGRTIAVLGCGIDIEYPKGSRKLFDQIKERGAVISEYALGAAPLSENFPRRNRIISGLSLGALVVEAARKSGSLITAHEAAEQGREVFALPGRVDQPTSSGCHQLIKEGAALVENPFEILEALRIQLWPLVSRQSTVSSPQMGSARDSMSEIAQGLISALASGPLFPDEIARRCLVSSGPLASTLTLLELQRKIQKKSDGRFVLAGAAEKRDNSF